MLRHRSMDIGKLIRECLDSLAALNHKREFLSQDVLGHFNQRGVDNRACVLPKRSLDPGSHAPSPTPIRRPRNESHQYVRCNNMVTHTRSSPAAI
jgi:hypothetical protein